MMRAGLNAASLSLILDMQDPMEQEQLIGALLATLSPTASP
jgi:hypothetical protein